MRRITSTDRVVDKHGPGRDGYRTGTAPGSSPTRLQFEQFDHTQEEIARVVERDIDLDKDGEYQGATLDDGNVEQMAEALSRYFARYAARNWSIGPRSGYAKAGEARPNMGNTALPRALAAGHSIISASKGVRAWVMVGGSGTSEPLWGFSRSPGGLWTAGGSIGNKNFNMNAVTYSPLQDRWIAVGDADGADSYVCNMPGILSTSGWLEAAVPGGNLALYAVHASQGNQLRAGFGGNATNRIIAAGQETAGDIHMAKSDNGGQTWFAVTTPPADASGVNARINSIVNLPGTTIWVAGGKAHTDIAKMWRSTDDGEIWSEVTPGGTGGSTILSMAWNGSKIVAVGTGGDYYTSSDGSGWTKFTDQIGGAGNQHVAADDTTGIIIAANVFSLRISYDDGANFEMLTGVPNPNASNGGWGGFGFDCMPGHEFGMVFREFEGSHGSEFDFTVYGLQSGQWSRGRRTDTLAMGTDF